jgi:hypothetical protein
MKRSSGSRKTAELSKSILQQLNMYTRAAGAAGVGVLALSQSAAAKIVYTPANVTFGLNQYGKYPIDFNHDGITDLTLSFFHTVRSVGFTSSFREYADRPNSVWRAPVGSRLANCTKAGGIIGRDRNFAYGSLYVGYVKGSDGKFLYGGLCEKHGKGVNDGYLGVRFMINGEPHFGWVRLTVMGGHPFKAELTGYAYETIPNKAIIAGKTNGPDDISIEEPGAALTTPTPGPATLGALALGARGLSLWRREEPVAAT